MNTAARDGGVVKARQLTRVEDLQTVGFESDQPIRLRNDVLHAPKATNPRAAAATAATTPIAFKTLTDNPYQPLTSHLLRTESGSPCSRVRPV